MPLAILSAQEKRQVSGLQTVRERTHDPPRPLVNRLALHRHKVKARFRAARPPSVNTKPSNTGRATAA
jgi:hypothetical protein